MLSQDRARFCPMAFQAPNDFLRREVDVARDYSLNGDARMVEWMHSDP
jgi:hypothetical protein